MIYELINSYILSRKYGQYDQFSIDIRNEEVLNIKSDHKKINAQFHPAEDVINDKAESLDVAIKSRIINNLI